ncbi:MAG: dephospho-CoA kinase [Oscillospiraceae bacterium]|nr:dephospho-CoA kinase [Oscillospiraceae bacterium]
MLSQKYENSIYVNADKISNDGLKDSQIIKVLVKEFGNSILDENGSIDRKKLRSLVFSDQNKLHFLEEIIWTFLQEELNNILSSAKSTVIIECIKFPLIGFWNKCDIKILVLSTNDEKRKLKVMERDNISAEDFYKREKASMDYNSYQFDHIIEHSYEEGELQTAANNIYKVMNK